MYQLQCQQLIKSRLRKFLQQNSEWVNAMTTCEFCSGLPGMHMAIFAIQNSIYEYLFSLL
jgi:hypothetical protein